jgi:hypothetical protein
MVKINNVKISDMGFYINLDKRTDRNEHLLRNLSEYKISGVNRYSAISEGPSPQLNLIKTTFEIYKKFLSTDAETLLVLEDDCKFLDILKEDYEEIFNNINNTDWDLFWIGCVNRRSPKFYKNKCYQVSSVSYAQSYIIKRKMCEDVLKNFENDCHNLCPDELLCLFAYGKDITANPNKYDFYLENQPLDKFNTIYKCLTYECSLSTQYNSHSDLWNHMTNLEDWIPSSHPKIK